MKASTSCCVSKRCTGASDTDRPSPCPNLYPLNKSRCSELGQTPVSVIQRRAGPRFINRFAITRERATFSPASFGRKYDGTGSAYFQSTSPTKDVRSGTPKSPADSTTDSIFIISFLELRYCQDKRGCGPSRKDDRCTDTHNCSPYDKTALVIANPTRYGVPNWPPSGRMLYIGGHR